jgi:hypothetical protein
MSKGTRNKYIKEVNKMTREQIDKELYFVERVLGDIRNVEIPKLVYDEEKEVVKKALLEYKSQLQDALYR